MNQDISQAIELAEPLGSAGYVFFFLGGGGGGEGHNHFFNIWFAVRARQKGACQYEHPLQLCFQNISKLCFQTLGIIDCSIYDIFAKHMHACIFLINPKLLETAVFKFLVRIGFPPLPPHSLY